MLCLGPWAPAVVSPRVEPAVHEWIVDTVGHGQPVDAQVRDLTVRRLVDLRIVMRDEEVGVVRGPTDLQGKRALGPKTWTQAPGLCCCIYPEDDHHHYHHLDNLNINMFVNTSLIMS